MTKLESLENVFPLGNVPIDKNDVGIEDRMGVAVATWKAI